MVPIFSCQNIPNFDIFGKVLINKMLTHKTRMGILAKNIPGPLQTKNHPTTTAKKFSSKNG
jgi:hypothetical protein